MGLFPKIGLSPKGGVFFLLENYLKGGCLVYSKGSGKLAAECEGLSWVVPPPSISGK